MNKMETGDPIFLLGVTDRRLAALRVVLALSALVISLIPSEPDRYARLTYYSISAYIAYSIIVFAVSRREVNFRPSVLRGIVWTDLVWATLLISLSSGSSSLFFFFYLFAVIVASSRAGFRFGLWVALVSSVLCLLVGWLVTPEGHLEVGRLAMRPFAIVGLGYILAYWGGAEVALRRKMALLNELSLVANPRFGVDWTIELILRRLLNFWDASYCLILLAHEDDMNLYLISRDDPQRCQKVAVQSRSDIPFIDVADPSGLVYAEQTAWAKRKSYKSFDPRTRAVATRPLPPGEALAEFLNARSFVSVPLHYRERFRGRIVVSSVQPDAFDVGDAAFLRQVASQALPLIENISLVDRLASDASEEERNRIARSVHDRVIQPYYGLQIGLKALHSVLNNGHNENGATNEEDKRPAALLAELMAMTSDGIDELRQYVSGLKQSRSGDTRLADSIRRFASKFEHATGIHVKLTDNTEGFVGNDRLTSEMFQMAAEALSNVHRHTHARSARVVLNLDGNVFQLQVENDRRTEEDPGQFMPGSISDRAEALGGRTEVLLEDDRTILRVDVPL
jgi:signal transduction histidine kinase